MISSLKVLEGRHRSSHCIAMAECSSEIEIVEDVVIVGAGIAGLATALGLHRLGMRSLVLESSDNLRVTGFALTVWTNAWKALEALGIADYLRQRSVLIEGFQVAQDPGNVEVSFGETFKNHESRCVRRRDLLEALAKELPPDAIKYSSKVVSIDVSGNSKLVQLADGQVVKCKILIGCDGINSVVAKWLGLQNPVNTGRLAIRGFVDFPNHGFKPEVNVHFHNGIRVGLIPSDANSFYWFCTFKQNDPNWHDDMAQNPDKLKSFVLSKAENMGKEVSNIMEKTNLDSISVAALKLRLPWNIYSKDIIARNGIFVAGDALHPMTPDLGQGGCSSLEDGVVLARCLGESFLNTDVLRAEKNGEAELRKAMKKCMDGYVKERRWRCVSLITVSYLNGLIQDNENKVISFLKERFFSKYIPSILLKMAEFDCGKLVVSST